MRVNIYAEEMTDRIEIIGKEIDGHTFTGLRFYLELPATLPSGENYAAPFIHRPGDDDSAAVTFWGKRDLREVLRLAIDRLDAHYAPPAAPPDDLVRLPSFIRDPIEREIEAAIHPKGMGIHDGKMRIGSDKIAYLLRRFDEAAAAIVALLKRVAELEAERECLILDYQGAYARAERAATISRLEADRDAWKIMSGGKQKLLERAEAERDDHKADALRLHKEKCDQYDARLVAEAERDAAIKALREAP